MGSVKIKLSRFFWVDSYYTIQEHAILEEPILTVSIGSHYQLLY